ncbi:Uncharacterised protein [Segatella copri]|nr:Uncharacterised protein [Segatella copri]
MLIANHIDAFELHLIDINTLLDVHTAGEGELSVTTQCHTGNEGYIAVEIDSVANLVFLFTTEDDSHTVFNHIPELSSLQCILSFLSIPVAGIQPHAFSILLVEVDASLGCSCCFTCIGSIIEVRRTVVCLECV